MTSLAAAALCPAWQLRLSPAAAPARTELTWCHVAPYMSLRWLSDESSCGACQDRGAARAPLDHGASVWPLIHSLAAGLLSIRWSPIYSRCHQSWHATRTQRRSHTHVIVAAHVMVITHIGWWWPHADTMVATHMYDSGHAQVGVEEAHAGDQARDQRGHPLLRR